MLLTNFHPEGGGGHVTYINTLTKINNDSQYVIGVVAPESSCIYKYLKDREYKHLYSCDFPGKIQKELPDIIKSIKRFRGIVKHFGPDIVHANGGADLFIILWSYPFGPRYSVVRTHHAIKGLGNDIYHRLIYRNLVKENIYVSETSMLISHSKGLKPKNTVVIENGVDLDYFSPTIKNKELATKYGIDDETFCFGSCAGVGRYKRIDVIIKAAIQLKNKYKFRILVLGDENAGKKLQDKARSLGLDEFIFCGFYKDVRPVVSLFDVGFILSDSIETTSFAAKEMMAMGKPLISTSFSGLRENISNGLNGYLVRPGNVEDVIAVMTKFMTMSKGELKLFSERARLFAERNFDVFNQIENHRIVYKRITSRSSCQDKRKGSALLDIGKKPNSRERSGLEISVS